MKPHIIYTPDYDIHFFGLEKLHPFDSRKYSRAWNVVHEQLGDKLSRHTINPPNPISDEDLLLVHTQEYLDSLTHSQNVATALEFPVLASLPFPLVKSRLITPMKLATTGTVMAAEKAVQDSIAINLSGGYHHASSNKGEGFCLFADIPIAIEKLRQSGALAPDDKALIIDLDAHQGNGYERVYHDQKNGVTIFDMYNMMIYPQDEFAEQRIDYDIRVSSGLNDEQYMSVLETGLPKLLKEHSDAKIAFYIAGTDIYKHDQLGRFKVSEEGVVLRDKYVLDSLVEADIPTVMVLGGGYSSVSYRMVASTLHYVLTKWG